MESLRSIIASMEKGEYLASIDIQDAYLHIPIAPAHQRFLIFAIDQDHYQFVALPFGLTTAPRVFTKVMAATMDVLHSRGIVVFPYLDDLLIKAPTFKDCELSVSITIDTLSRMGWPSGKFTLHWEGPVIDDVSLVEYSGVPFIIVGRQVLGCHFGKDRAAAQKRPAEFTSQTEIAYCPLVKRRRFIMQNTKKMNCPAKIYIYHIMKFPDFQIKKKSKWQMKLASQKIKDSLDTTMELIHSYIILFPLFSHHKNHPVEAEETLTKERVDPRIIKKITELFESGVSKRRDIKILLDHFVRFELFVGQDIPVNSRRRFFPSLKDINNITRRGTSKRKSPAVDQNTETHLLT
ncbi:unnamed protein product [Ranitomeya imitator]|uniref:ribonuclease H n=1 Tax=Ranitomeya imitator TaxID=111125 RepID=A0ABN9LEJ6_9NEOB|nr:unnamed protein product [Ranitomeya imitator]